MRPPTFAQAPGILFISLSAHEFLLPLGIRKTSEMENDRNENWVRELIKPKLALSSTENWHAEGARETGGRTASSGSMTDSLKFFFFFFTFYSFTLCVGGVNTSWCTLEVRGQLWEPTLSFHHAVCSLVDELLKAQGGHSALSAPVPWTQARVHISSWGIQEKSRRWPSLSA